MEAREEESEVKRAVDMIIKYAYVPDTNEPVFESTDADLILKWPFGVDLMKLQMAIVKLTGIDIADAEAQLEKSPLREQS